MLVVNDALTMKNNNGKKCVIGPKRNGGRLYSATIS